MPSSNPEIFPGCLGQGIMTLFGKPADQEDGGLVSQRTILCAVLNRSVVSDSLRPLWTWLTRHLCPWGFSRQEYWSGLPCPSPGDRPNPGIESRSPTLQADSLLPEPPGEPKEVTNFILHLLFFLPGPFPGPANN